MRVKDVMAKPNVINEHELATKARAILHAKHLRTLCVVDKQDKLVGLIDRKIVMGITSSKSDLPTGGIAKKSILNIEPGLPVLEAAKALVRTNLKEAPVVEDGKLIGFVGAHALLNSFLKAYKPVKKEVREVMSRNTLAVDANELLHVAWPKLSEHSALPVIKNKKVVGVVTRKDFLKFGKVHFAREGGIKSSPPVERIMTTPVYSVKPEDPIETAVLLLLRLDVGAIPVIEGEKLAGIVTRYDLLKAYTG